MYSDWYNDISSGPCKHKCHVCNKKQEVRVGTIAVPVNNSCIIEVYWILCKKCRDNGWEPNALVYNENHEYRINNLYRNTKTGKLKEIIPSYQKI